LALPSKRKLDLEEFRPAHIEAIKGEPTSPNAQSIPPFRFTPNETNHNSFVDTRQSSMIAEMRPEFKQLMIDAWYNQYFAIAFAAPVVLHVFGFVLFRLRWKVVAAVALPMSILFYWAFASMGMFHVYDLWA
jgi:hypothetical protein